MSAPERLCVACGRTVAIPCRFDPVPDCPSPDACTLDMTADEAWQYWRGVAHEQRTAHAAAVQRAAEDARREALEDFRPLLDMLPPGPWEVWTSCSFRRITGSDRRDGGVLCGIVQRSDGHPDLSMPADQLAALCEIVNRLRALAAKPAPSAREDEG